MVVQSILGKIRSGELKPGDRLPSERDLAETLQVSRVSIREGIKVLSSMGLLDVRVGDGTIVKRVDVTTVIRPLLETLHLANHATIQVLETRKIIEVALAGLAAKKAKDEDVVELGSILADMKNNFYNEELFRENDANFHVAIAKIAQNEILYKILFTIRDMLKNTSDKTYQVPKAWDRALMYHEQIYSAIEDRDSGKAEEVMLHHLEDVEKSLALLRDQVDFGDEP